MNKISEITDRLISGEITKETADKLLRDIITETSIKERTCKRCGRYLSCECGKCGH